MNRIIVLIMLSWAYVVGAKAEEKVLFMADTLEENRIFNQNEVLSSRESLSEIKLQLTEFLMRKDSAMLYSGTDFLRKIDSAYVHPEQKNYYHYLLKVLKVQEEMRKVEEEHLAIRKLEEKLISEKIRIVNQVEQLRNNTNVLIDYLNSGVVELSAEHNQYLDNLIGRVVTIRDRYKTVPPRTKQTKNTK